MYFPLEGLEKVLLPVGDLHEALIFDLPDVAGVQPPFGIEGLARGLGREQLAMIPAHHPAAFDEQLAVRGDP